MTEKQQKVTGTDPFSPKLWLLIQTLAIFLGFFISIYVVTGDWRAAAISAVGVNVLFILLYATTGRLFIKGMGR